MVKHVDVLNIIQPDSNYHYRQMYIAKTTTTRFLHNAQCYGDIICTKIEVNAVFAKTTHQIHYSYMVYLVNPNWPNMIFSFPLGITSVKLLAAATDHLHNIIGIIGYIGVVKAL